MGHKGPVILGLGASGPWGLEPNCNQSIKQSINQSSPLNEYIINTWRKNFIQTIIIIKILHSEDGVTDT